MASFEIFDDCDTNATPYLATIGCSLEHSYRFPHPPSQLGELPLGEGEGAKHSPPGGGHAT